MPDESVVPDANEAFKNGLERFEGKHDEVILDPEDPLERDLLDTLAKNGEFLREAERIDRDELGLPVDSSTDDSFFSTLAKASRIAALYHRELADFEAKAILEMLKDGLSKRQQFNEDRIKLKKPLDAIMAMDPDERLLNAMAVEGRYVGTEIEELVASDVEEVRDAIKERDESRERAGWVELFFLEEQKDPKGFAEEIDRIGRNIWKKLDDRE